MVELNLGENYTPDVQNDLNQEVAEHTEDCAYNMAMKTQHLDCRDCKCHHYKNTF